MNAPLKLVPEEPPHDKAEVRIKAIKAHNRDLRYRVRNLETALAEAQQRLSQTEDLLGNVIAGWRACAGPTEMTVMRNRLRLTEDAFTQWLARSVIRWP